MKLRNPHGRGNAEWKGDWSDTCPNWNARMKSKLKYEPRDHEDGVFWMDAFDFAQQYSYVYICRILTQ
jgi:calpain-12